MDRREKLNLIPDEIREKYSRKYLAGFIVLVAVFLIISISIPYISMAVVNKQISKIERKNEAYQYQEQKIEGLDAEIEIYSRYINEYTAMRFPFSDFLSDLELLKPVSVNIISVDSPDRLINEGAVSEEKAKENKETENEEATAPEIKYEKDLCLQKITIRGYGSSQKDISDYLHSISELSYIKKLNVVAIEEHKIENGVYNIFEATVEGWGYNENQIP